MVQLLSIFLVSASKRIKNFLMNAKCKVKDPICDSILATCSVSKLYKDTFLQSFIFRNVIMINFGSRDYSTLIEPLYLDQKNYNQQKNLTYLIAI